MKKKTIQDFNQMVANDEKITYITAYDYLTAKYVERAGMDMILVGDSLGMVQYGYENTFAVTMDDMIRHTAAVRRGAPNTFIVGDMPYMSYQPCDEDAIRNAGRFISEGKADCIKLEGAGELILSRIKAINDAGVLVMGHIGLTPQFAGQLGGFKAQGRTGDAAVKLVKQALAVEAAGACSMLIEGVPAIVGREIAKRVNIPALGIGAGSFTHGQILICADMLGMYDDFIPKFAKRYTNIGEQMQKAFEEYAKEIREVKFPNDAEHAYKITDEESDKFMELLEKEGI